MSRRTWFGTGLPGKRGGRGPFALAIAALAVTVLITACPTGDEGPAGPSAGDRDVRTLNNVSVPFRYVPAGSFQRDGTTTNITVISQGYWMGETEVTQELFQKVMGTNPSYFDGTSGGSSYAKDTPTGEAQTQWPVELVSWYDAIAFCNKLSLAKRERPGVQRDRCYRLGKSCL
jgi:hypothetical protein